MAAIDKDPTHEAVLYEPAGRMKDMTLTDLVALFAVVFFATLFGLSLWTGGLP